MDTAGTLFGPPESGTAPFDPREHRLYRKVTDGRGHVLHSEWLRAKAEGRPVGTCRNCGGLLTPHTPVDVSSHRTDYEAECLDRKDGQPWCGWLCAIPGGRYLPGSSRKGQQYDFKNEGK